jgi:hypothetical protein
MGKMTIPKKALDASMSCRLLISVPRSAGRAEWAVHAFKRPIALHQQYSTDQELGEILTSRVDN